MGVVGYLAVFLMESCCVYMYMVGLKEECEQNHNFLLHSYRMVGWEVVSIEVVVVMCLQVGLAEASQMSLKRERLGKFVLTHTVQAQFDNKGLQKHRIHNNRHDVHNHCNRTVQRVCLCVTLGTNN